MQSPRDCGVRRPGRHRSGGRFFTPPADLDELGEFAAGVSERYGELPYGIEVWPELNLLPNWSVTGPDLRDTLASGRLRACARRTPDTVLVSGGLAPTTDVGVCHMSDLVFLDRLAATGALAAVDAVGIEPFGLRSPPADRRTASGSTSAAPSSRGVPERHGSRACPYAAVAWGWNAGEDPAASPWGAHPPDVAAAWLWRRTASAGHGWPPGFVSATRHCWRPSAAGFALVDERAPDPLRRSGPAIAGRLAAETARPRPVSCLARLVWPGCARRSGGPHGRGGLALVPW
jgi:hypothetical protein